MNSQDAFSITAVSDCLVPIFSRYPVLVAYLYGSVVANHLPPFSDVDIALLVDPDTITPSQRLQVELAIEDEIAQICNISQADVRIINEAPLVFKGQVVTEGILLFARDEESRIEFETQTRLAYFDFLPTVRAVREAFFDDILQHGLAK